VTERKGKEGSQDQRGSPVQVIVEASQAWSCCTVSFHRPPTANNLLWILAPPKTATNATVWLIFTSLKP
jgi:hypothetical protein